MTPTTASDAPADLKRRVILSISSDIGDALARDWMAAGCSVAGTYRKRSAAVDALEQAGASLVACDLDDAGSIAAAVAELGHEPWDVLVLAAGDMAPVAPFALTDFDSWERSIKTNFTAQLRVLHGLLPARRTGSELGPLVLMFAGGGTNSATPSYSAYTVMKIASIKMCELLDAELPDTRFAIVGPGWVKTKIHKATLDAGEKAGNNYQRTLDMLGSESCVPMERVIASCNWIVDSPRDVVGGRNLSTAHDHWGTSELAAMLRENPDMYKLRRAGNDALGGDGDGLPVTAEDVLAQQFDYLADSPESHTPGSLAYGLLDATARHVIAEMFGPDNEQAREFGPFGQITFPYVSMGAIDSRDLFGLDELIIFAFYWRNRERYRKVGDVGANIGAHSLMLSRSGFTVRSFEPDPKHVALLKRTLELNEAQGNVEIVEAAVSDKEGSAEFVRVLGNTTGSHLSGAKSSPYGELERFEVSLLPIGSIMEWADLVKIDAEGHESQIISGTERNDWQGTDAMIEVGSVENAEKVFRHLNGIGINMFAQKIGWKLVTRAEDMPESYRDGSLFVTLKDHMPWPVDAGD